MSKPETEVAYCWKEWATVAGYEAEGKRLLTPWSDPNQYEFDFDFLSESPEAAVQLLEDMGVEKEESDEWVLVRCTLEPVERPSCAI